MRSLVLLAAITATLAVTLAYPFAGLILWIWFSLQNPHEEAYSLVQGLPLNLIIAVVTVAAWLFSRERKLPPRQFLVWTMTIFLLWMTFNSFFAFDPGWSWPYWDRVWKTFALGLMITVLATNPVRIHAVVWICVLSLFYYGVKGGLFTLVTGGVNHVLGPPNTEIADNNQLALALLMTLPLANYLRRQSANRWISLGVALGMALTVLSVLGSYSRGGLVGLIILTFASIWRSRRRLIYLMLAAAASVAILFIMPDTYWHRASTIESAGNDPSFHARTIAWQVSFRYAVDHFPFGGGFYSTQLPSLYHHYFPDESEHAAHSIFFQVLGEHGFIGLSLYLFIIVLAFSKCATIIRRVRDRPELEWASNLARMLQLSLIVFCAGGAALSMAYYDMFVVCIALLVPLSHIAATRSSDSPTRMSRSAHVGRRQPA